MSNRRRAQTRRQRQAAIGTAVLSALIAGGLSAPAQAEPAPGAKITTVPDPGARPVANGLPQLPSGRLARPVTLPVAPKDALAAQLAAAITDQQVLAEARLELRQQHDNAVLDQAMADYAWRISADELHKARDAAEQAAVEAYQAAGKLPPDMTYGSTLRDLGALLPRKGDMPTVTESAARDLARANQAERAAYAKLTEAIAAEKRAAAALATMDVQYLRCEKALLELQRRMTALKTEEDRRLEREEQNLGAGYDAGKSNAGLMANFKARKAVLFALDQLGKPYQWGDEGPNRFDCSGLMWASYRSVGVSLNRVAKDQYFGTRAKTVSTSALLPGDLLFFATNPSDWHTIHHVGMYLGDGRMVHSPTTGDFVKVSRVNLYNVDFATRVLDAIPAPQQPNPAPTTPKPKPTKTTSPTPTPTATPTSTPTTAPPTVTPTTPAATNTPTPAQTTSPTTAASTPATASAKP